MSITVESGLWTLDGLRSSVTFRHKTMWGLLTVRGRFASFAGQGERLADGTGRGTLTIDVASPDTKHPKRDEHLRSDDVFNADRYPVIIFTARRLTLQPNNKVRVDGYLTVRGESRPLSFTARARRTGQGGIILSAELSIDHADYGVTWNQMGMLRSPATLSLNLRFVHRPG